MPVLTHQGVTCILPVLREGVLTGSPEQKEEAAKALGCVIRLTSPEALKPSVVNITGPLIRILGDRFSWSVKTALLETLTLLLAKVMPPPLVPPARSMDLWPDAPSALPPYRWASP